MRARFIGLSAAIMLLLSMIGLIATANAAPAAQAVGATATATKGVRTPTATATKPAPAATHTATATTAPTETATEAATATMTAAATPAASPVAETTTTPVAVVTLVLWYEQTPSGGPLKIGPIKINENGVSGPGDATGAALTGSVDFEDPKNNSLPRIVLGDSNFDGYAVNPDDPNSVLRWTYFNDDSSMRPSTLVVQVTASAGPYKGYNGSATFISRASKAGGVLVISLNPPSS